MQSHVTHTGERRALKSRSSGTLENRPELSVRVPTVCWPTRL
ncbi:hypothetical protein HSR122_0485 [Halapricum desulfuricans]|uniref:Uncharacterized protein n=1 Tax=Halapricum desulfuricans TaxID=2841257 RepID=A0A897N4U4_9EURY|nr:hypothetical protein HSR122_0485 [Halapricum desulfuricans]